MTNDKNSYFNRAHRLGRIGTIIAILFMIGIPVVVCFIYDVMPTFSEVFTTAIGLLAVYGAHSPFGGNQLHSYAGHSLLYHLHHRQRGQYEDPLRPQRHGNDRLSAGH